MIHWAELYERDFTSRFTALSKFLTEHKIDNEFQRLLIEPGQSLELVHQKISNLQVGHLAWPLSENLDFISGRASREVMNYHYADALVRSANVLWPQNLLSKAVPQAVGTILNLDTSQTALIVGGSGLARFAISLASRMGYRKIFCLNQHDEKLDVASMSKWLFNMEIEIIDADGLIKLPSRSTMIVLALPVYPENLMWEELSYFNYLMKDSLALNISNYVLPPDFRAALAEASCRCIDRDELDYYVDSTWVGQLTDLSFTQSAYLDFFRSHG